MLCAKHGIEKTQSEGRSGRLRCSKCKTEQRRRSKQNKRDWLRGLYLSEGCAMCGYSKCWEALEFHHVDPDTKEYAVSKLMAHSFLRIMDEARKCIVLCANCHRELHAGLIDVAKLTKSHP